MSDANLGAMIGASSAVLATVLTLLWGWKQEALRWERERRERFANQRLEVGSRFFQSVSEMYEAAAKGQRQKSDEHYEEARKWIVELGFLLINPIADQKALELLEYTTAICGLIPPGGGVPTKDQTSGLSSRFLAVRMAIREEIGTSTPRQGESGNRMVRTLLPVTGVLLTLLASYFLARGSSSLGALEIAELAAMKLGYNPDLVAGLAQQSSDARVGIVLLCLAAALQFVTLAWPLTIDDLAGGMNRRGIVAATLLCGLVAAAGVWASRNISQGTASEARRILDDRQQPRVPLVQGQSDSAPDDSSTTDVMSP